MSYPVLGVKIETLPDNLKHTNPPWSVSCSKEGCNLRHHAQTPLWIQQYNLQVIHNECSKNILFLYLSMLQIATTPQSQNCPFLVKPNILYIKKHIAVPRSKLEIPFTKMTSLITTMSSSNTIKLFTKRNEKWFVLKLGFRLNPRL